MYTHSFDSKETNQRWDAVADKTCLTYLTLDDGQSPTGLRMILMSRNVCVGAETLFPALQ